MIDIKRQTKRTTKFLERFANSINVFAGKMQIGISTSNWFGDFSEVNNADRD